MNHALSTKVMVMTTKRGRGSGLVMRKPRVGFVIDEMSRK